MDSISSFSDKRSCPEYFLLQPAKICKIDKAFKENVPPNNTEKPDESQNSEQIDFRAELQNSGRATPIKYLQTREEPITPNTNIKLLTSLASVLDYAQCNTPKSIKSSMNSTMDDEDEICLEPALKPSRKEKSLCLICFKFLNIYPLHPDPAARIVVSLDEASQKLQVERRRLYDIVNVFESIHMLSKLAKNRYMWYGKNNLLKALNNIKATAVAENVERKLQYVLNIENLTKYSKQACILDEVQDFNKRLQLEKESLIKQLIVQTSPTPEVRKEKSLALMSQKFLMLFLVSPTKVISLGVAAKVLNGFHKSNKGAQIKTQIRRLYDIANVLSSIGLIQKQITNGATGKKPAFKYIGPDLGAVNDKENGDASRLSSLSNKMKPRSLIRHSSFQEICAVAELEHQKLCLEKAPKSAPPFERNINESDRKTSFENFNLGNKSSQEKETSLLTRDDNKCVRNLRVLHTIQPKVTNAATALEEGKTTLQVQQNMMFVNKPAVTKNGSFYILNSNAPVSYNSTGTVLLLNNYVPIIPHKDDVKQKISNKVDDPRTIELSPLQRDIILKSLNLSLSAGQVAAIQLTGSSEPINSTNNTIRIVDTSNKVPVEKKQINLNNILNNSSTNSTYNTIKILDTSNRAPKENNRTNVNDIINTQKINLNSTESNGSSICSTRNNSPSFRYESPLTIPSGYATPVLSNSSDITSFPSNSEVDSILKKIENAPDNSKNNLDLCELHVIGESVKMVDIYQGQGISTTLQFKADPQVKGLEAMQQNSDSCSSESLNAEVSSILKEVPLGEIASATNRSQSFLIDEKTILSPIKKPYGATKVLTPSPLLTPPYVGPDTLFVYHPYIKIQNINKVSAPNTTILKVKAETILDTKVASR